jgi:hypothetical protein
MPYYKQKTKASYNMLLSVLDSDKFSGLTKKKKENVCQFSHIECEESLYSRFDQKSCKRNGKVKRQISLEYRRLDDAGVALNHTAIIHFSLEMGMRIMD